jgi:uncharacterized protein DUF5675
MDVFKIDVIRTTSYSGSIIGEMWINGSFLCYTLELPWLQNQKGVSCVPNGRYDAMVRYDKADGWRIQLIGVTGRSGVQIHVGNYPRDIQGCVLVGTSAEANRVLNSKAAYQLLKEAFYGSATPKQSPAKSLSVEFSGIQASPWGDQPAVAAAKA